MLKRLHVILRKVSDCMKCPFCEKEGKVSRVYVGASESTLLAWTPYYDEEGNYHSNNPNRITTRYSCSNGHEWSEST